MITDELIPKPGDLAAAAKQASELKFVEHAVSAESGKLYVRDYSGGGPAFLLMHGFPDNLHINDELISYLAAAGRRVVAFDFLGYGASDKPAGATYSFKQQLGDLCTVVDALGLETIIPVGHDAAGPAAINFAIDYPKRVASLCLLNTIFAAAPSTRLPEMIELFATKSLGALALAIAQDPDQLTWLLKWQQNRLAENLSHKEKAHFKAFLGPLIDNNFLKLPSSGPAFMQMTADLFAEVARNTQRIREMEALEISVNIIWGDKDPYLNVGVAEDFHSHFKRSSLHVISAGHWLQIDAPDQVARIMLGHN